MVRQTPCLPYLGVRTVSTKASGSGRRSRHIAGLLHETGERQLRQWTRFARSVSSRRWGKSPGPLPGDSPSDNCACMGDAGAASVTNNRQADPQTAADCEPAKQCTGRGITVQVS